MTMSLKTLASSLASSVVPGSPAFVLVDPMMGEPIPIEYSADALDLPAPNSGRERAWLRPVHVIKLAQNIAVPPHLHPYLVELQGPDDPWLADTVEIACEEQAETQAAGLASRGVAAHCIGGWLQSSLSPGDLTRTLTAMMNVNTEARTTALYQRLADRRALGWLRHVVGDARVVAPFGRIQSWHYLDACGRLALLQSSAEVASPLRLTHGEWAAFMTGALLHPTVARWLGELALQPNQSEASPVDAGACYAQAGVALERAEAAARRWPRRFADPADRVAWAVLSLLHPGIEQSPDVVAMLNAPAEPDEPHEPIETLDALSPTLNTLRLKATP